MELKKNYFVNNETMITGSQSMMTHPACYMILARMKLLLLLFVAFFFKFIYSQSCSGTDYQATNGTDVTINGPCPPYIAVPSYISTTVQFICSYNYSGGLFAPYWNVTGFPPISTISASPSSSKL